MVIAFLRLFRTLLIKFVWHRKTSFSTSCEDNKNAFPSHNGTKRQLENTLRGSTQFSHPGPGLLAEPDSERSLLTDNVVKTCTLLSRYRLARGTFPLLARKRFQPLALPLCRPLEGDMSRVFAAWIFINASLLPHPRDNEFSRTRSVRCCHPECSEGSGPRGTEMLRFAQHDILGFGRENSLSRSLDKSGYLPPRQGAYNAFMLLRSLDAC